MSKERSASYRQYASLCEAIAKETIDPTRKRLLGEMAHYWTKLDRDEGGERREPPRPAKN
jgi:hypothetical protein